MKTTHLAIRQMAIIGLITVFFFGGKVSICYAQYRNSYSHQPVSLIGPRIGFTIIGGEIAEELRKEHDAKPIVTQFGWQFEWRFFSVDDGPTGVVEVIPLIGGLEQGLFLPSLAVPMGIRFNNGFEIGTGPNVSLSGFGIVLGLGQTFRSGELYFPVNFALVPSKKGARFSLVFGFNTSR